MAAIGSIRKHGVFLMIIIGVALLAFIIGDLTNVINFGRNTVMQVGNKKIEAGATDNTYSEYFQQNLEYLKIRNKNNPLYEENSTILNEEAHRLTYEQIQHETILDEQLKKLGLSFTDEMLAEVKENALKSANNPESLMGAVISYAWAENIAGVNDAQSYNQLVNFFNTALQSPENMEQINKESSLYKAYKAVERIYIIEAKENTYFGLAVNSIHFPKRMLAQMADNNKRISGQMVGIDFNHPAFDDIKIDISEKDAKAYFKEHKNRYTIRQTEKDVEIAYFTVNPTAEDRQATSELADTLFKQLKNSESIREFTSQPAKIEKIDLKYAQNNRDPYTYNLYGANTVAAYAQVDTTLYLKAGETALQKRNELSQSPRGYSNRVVNLTPDWQALLTPTSNDSVTYIEPRPYSNNMIYFGQVRDVQNRPDSIQIVQVVLRYADSTKTDKDNKDMTEEEAYAKALEIKAAVDGKDSTAMLPYIVETGDSLLRPYYLLDGASFDGIRYFYSTNDTMTSNWYNELIKTDVNSCYIHKREDVNLYSVDMVVYKSEPVLKSQYVLYPVPIFASSNTDKKARQTADKVTNCNTVEEMTKVAKKNGGEVISTTITGMQYNVSLNNNLILDCREAIDWAFNTNKNADNEVGSVAHNTFIGHLTTYNQMTQEVSVNEVVVAIGITASTEIQSPSFKDMKERVIRDMKAEKKREAVVARLKKEFNGSNMAEIASKYSTSPQQMTVNFSEYGNMESAAVGKIAELSAGKNTVVGGNNYAYLVSVTQVEKGSDVKKQTLEQITNQFKSSYQMDDATAQKEAENSLNWIFTNYAYCTALIEVPGAGTYRQYPLVEVVKYLVYNDITDDLKLADNRSRFYGASDSNR